MFALGLHDLDRLFRATTPFDIVTNIVPQHLLAFDDDGASLFPSIPLSKLALLEFSFTM
jgi:hypothetical protein